MSVSVFEHSWTSRDLFQVQRHALSRWLLKWELNRGHWGAGVLLGGGLAVFQPRGCQCGGFRCRSSLAAVCAFTLGLCGVGAFVYNLGQPGRSPACSLAVRESKGFWSGLSGFRSRPHGNGSPGQLGTILRLPLSAVNSTSALLSASGRCIALNLLLLFISHTVVMLPLSHNGREPKCHLKAAAFQGRCGLTLESHPIADEGTEPCVSSSGPRQWSPGLVQHLPAFLC